MEKCGGGYHLLGDLSRTRYEIFPPKSPHTTPPGNVRSNLFTTPQPILVICFPAITSSWSLFNGQQLYQTSNALVAAPYRKMSDKLTTQKEREKRPVESVISSSQSCAFFPADFLSRSIKCNLCRQKASGYKERLHPVGKSVPQGMIYSP